MPFCPRCKSEYREGFKECSDCHVPLVERLGGGSPLIEQEAVISKVEVSSLPFVTVFVSDNPEEAGMVEILLSDSKIPFITRGKQETRGKYVDFLVREDKASEAKEILKHIIEGESAGISQELTVDEEDIDSLKNRPVLPVKEPRQEPQGSKQGQNNTYLFAFMGLAVIIAAALIPGIVLRLRYGVIIAVMIVLAVSSFAKDKRM